MSVIVKGKYEKKNTFNYCGFAIVYCYTYYNIFTNSYSNVSK